MVESGVTEGGRTLPVFFFVRSLKLKTIFKVIPEEKEQLVQEKKKADNIRKVLCKSFIQWF